MFPKLKNTLICIGSIFIGGLFNMAIVSASNLIFPPPAGTDLTTEAGLQAAMPLMQPIDFLMPFLAHALGTVVAAILASLIAKSHRNRCAMATGIVFLFGGAMAVSMLPAPLWFNITDLVLAYIPMAMLGYWISTKIVAEPV
ncbi:MAG: hypothetical protein RIR98_1303 [Bacteroidota bacterium]